MTIVTGNGLADRGGLGNQAIQQAFQSGTIQITSFTSTSIVANGVTFTGTGFTYTSSVQNGQTIYQPTGGTITGISAGSQTWSNFSVSLTTAFNDILNANAFNELFFGGDDTFNWSAPGSSLGGYDGNDTFNVSNWGTGSGFGISGGAGNDTLNITGGITGAANTNPANTPYAHSGNFNVSQVETVNLAAGSDYTIIAGPSLVTAGNTMVIDASALGSSNSFIFSNDVAGDPGSFFSGNIVLKGGAGNDFFQGGTGNNTFIGGGGTDTVDFYYSTQSYYTGPGVTVDLSNPNPQSVGGEYGGTDTFQGITNIIGTPGNDTLTGNASDNVFYGEGGNDTINGGAGFDTAVFNGAYSNYTITYSGSNTVVSTGSGNTTTLTSVEMGQFSDKTVQISGPVMTTTDKRAAAGQSVALSTLFSVNDLNGAAITQYQLWDSSTDPSSGYFTVNGVAQAPHTVITISAAQLAQTAFVGGADDTSLQIRAYDGTSWSASDNTAWAPFTAGPGIDNAPVVTTSTVSASRNQTLPLSSLFSVSDADGDTMTEYQLWDSTNAPGSGYFTVNGVAQPAQTAITISAAQLAQTDFVTGMVSASLQIRAFDGYKWSAADNANWAPFTVSLPTDNPPVVLTSNVNKGAGKTLSLSSLISVSDADGDAMTQYQLWDSTRDPNAGYWVVNGVAQPAGQVITISAAQLAQTSFVTGSVATSLQVRAFDGALWSAPDTGVWAPFTVGPTPPVVSTYTQNLVPANMVAFSTLFSASDPDGDALTEYQIWDSTRDPNAGYVTVNGVRQAAGTVIDISAAQLAQTSFVAGSVATGLQIRAFDGTSWSAAANADWAPFTVSPPVPAVHTGNLTETAGQTLALSSLFSVTDSNSLPMTQYELWDATRDPNAGYFTINGVAQPAGTVIEVSAAQLSQTSFVTGSVATSLQIRAYDGYNWSAADNAAWAPFTVGPPVYYPPIVNTTSFSAHHDQTISFLNLFGVTDPNGNTITQYQAWDSTSDPNSGYFVVDGQVQPASTAINISAAQASSAYFVTGTVGDELQIRAYDGYNWSAAYSANWAPFNVSILPNSAPVVTTSNVNTTAGQTLALSSLFSVSDADGDTMTKYELWDSTSDPNSGHFVINGVAQPSNTIIDVSAAQLSQTSFLTGSVGDALQIRAFDGMAWSAADNAAWAPFHVNIS